MAPYLSLYLQTVLPYESFPNGESGADVYDRITLFEDHLVRDMIIGRYAGLNLVLVTHGLTLRIFLMKWFHWTVEEMLEVRTLRCSSDAVKFKRNNTDTVDTFSL